MWHQTVRAWLWWVETRGAANWPWSQFGPLYPEKQMQLPEPCKPESHRPWTQEHTADTEPRPTRRTQENQTWLKRLVHWFITVLVDVTWATGGTVSTRKTVLTGCSCKAHLNHHKETHKTFPLKGSTKRFSTTNWHVPRTCSMTSGTS